VTFCSSCIAIYDVFISVDTFISSIVTLLVSRSSISFFHFVIVFLSFGILFILIVIDTFLGLSNLSRIQLDAIPDFQL